MSTAVSTIKATQYRHYATPEFCLLLGSCDIGEAVTNDGEHVYTTWGRNLTQEQADWYREHTWFQLIDLDGRGELIVTEKMMALIRPSLGTTAPRDKQWMTPVTRD